MIKQIETTNELKKLLETNDDFAKVVKANMEEDEMYWHERFTDDFIYNTQVKGFCFDSSRTNVTVYDFEKFVKTFRDGYTPTWADYYFPTDLWERYKTGTVSRHEFFYAINLACEMIEEDYKDEEPKQMPTEDELLENQLNGNDYWYNSKTNEVMKLEIEYSGDLDTTFIFKINEYNEREKVVVFYCGEPTEENTLKFLSRV